MTSVSSATANPTKATDHHGGGSTAKRLRDAADGAVAARMTMTAAAYDIEFLRAELHKLAEEMRDRIDGATDGPAIDGWLSEQIRTIEWALKETK